MEKYVVARKSLDETMRDSLRLSDKDDLALISTTLSLSNEILYELKDDGTKYKLMNLEWDYNYFKSKVNILKSQYLAELYDLTKDTSTLDSAMECLNSCSFPNNNDGELAGVEYRKGKILIKYDSPEKDRDAGIAFSNSLIYGAPRKGYDIDATEALNKLLVKNNIPLSPIEASRASHLYKGPTFDNETEQAGFKDSKLTRIAVGDYNNDGWDDLLLGGLEIYKNNQNSTFTPVTKELVKEINSASGGLWADINKDGNLDFIKLSADVNGHGDRLFLADGEGRFLKSDNNIDDFANTEGAGIIDIDMDGYPELYSANYENWSAKTYYEDKFWKNTKGHLSDKSAEYGFVNSYNDSLKSQAGRGVAPADYDNDGIQELLVTNYRLTRNFLYDMNNNKATDKAGLELIAGKDVEGWFGHSIGADWGDFDNDGDLDLFIANLAHPRYIEFSDISMLLRNDGEKIKKIGENEYRYTQFTDITSTSGITFDELHSDPSWFDADNDGDLDLFITSIYTNDRSYLYLNNGDYTFTDITWLSGCRMYNGWGNATADFNRDGKLDLIVGSGNGVKLFMNSTVNNNQSASYKLYWKNNKIKYIKSSKWKDSLPNSPAFGARLRLTTIDKNKNIKTQIRELRGSKGTTSQSSQTLHFGLGETKLKKVEIIKY
ncbi:MAG: hypothetical protein B6226_05560 [Candidatus Cloacimonetes bacterium 4572_65]|nr:MAG: hypothetical protein B6226_05560 [Candidatus Cloacimonetes bacterium 4572_65]